MDHGFAADRVRRAETANVVPIQWRFVSYLTSIRVFVRVDEDEMLLAAKNAMEMIESIAEEQWRRTDTIDDHDLDECR